MDIMLEKSLIDCHCKGLDSLVLKDKPNMVRLFIARPDHNLYLNDLDHRFSIALHRHHCDVTLMPILGEVYNIRVSKDKNPKMVDVGSFKYRTPIGSGGPGEFVAVDDNPIPVGLDVDKLTGPTFLRAEALHTIYVPYGKAAAWFVWEGEENPNHNPIVYSNADLAQFDFSKIDLPMTEARLEYDLRLIGVGLL